MYREVRVENGKVQRHTRMYMFSVGSYVYVHGLVCMYVFIWIKEGVCLSCVCICEYE